jgi:hypothetical protein
MTFGKAVPKLVPSFMTRRIRLGVAHHGAPSGWVAPTKDTGSQQTKPQKKRR